MLFVWGIQNYIWERKINFAAFFNEAWFLNYTTTKMKYRSRLHEKSDIHLHIRQLDWNSENNLEFCTNRSCVIVCPSINVKFIARQMLSLLEFFSIFKYGKLLIISSVLIVIENKLLDKSFEIQFLSWGNARLFRLLFILYFCISSKARKNH